MASFAKLAIRLSSNAGLVQPRRAAGRTVFIGSRKRIERLLEDARATIARWRREDAAATVGA